MHNYFSRLFLKLKNKTKKTFSLARFNLIRKSSIGSLNNSVFNLKHRSNIYIYNSLAFLSFLVLTFFAVKLLAPSISTNANTKTETQNVGPYAMSLSNEDIVSIDITPTPTQSIYTKDTNIVAKNTCEAGASISISTNSNTSNKLTRLSVNGDTLPKDILATTTPTLDDNSWGYQLNNSSNYLAVPKQGEAVANIYDTTSSQTTNLTIPIKFAVKTDDTIPSGTYTNDLLYTMTPKPGCLGYGITWDFNKGTKKPNTIYPISKNWNETINLNELIPARDGYTFMGWKEGANTYTGTVDINPTKKKNIAMKAEWKLVNFSKNFDYTGNEQTLTVPETGYYKLEVWGAQGGGGEVVSGGGYTKTAGRGGYGAYAVGLSRITKNSNLYINVGGQGKMCNLTGAVCPGSGGYNGGGYAWSDTLANGGQETSGGGGATHVATASGLLSNLESSKQSILIVAAGGGGGGEVSRVSNIARGEGGDGGGVVGVNGNDYSPGSPHPQGRGAAYCGKGASFSAGGGNGGGNSTPSVNYNVGFGYFGHGGEYGSRIECCGNSGGGGGWYGGGISLRGHGGGGGGSSYIGSSKLLSGGAVIKHSTCFECSSFSQPDSMTSTTSQFSGTAIADYSKTGNGYAKITYLGDSI